MLPISGAIIFSPARLNIVRAGNDRHEAKIAMTLDSSPTPDSHSDRTFAPNNFTQCNVPLSAMVKEESDGL